MQIIVRTSSYLDIVSEPEALHSYQTLQSLGQDQKLRKPEHMWRKMRTNKTSQKMVMKEITKAFLQLKKSVTVYRTSKVTAYCMFSMEARRTLLSGSSFFPSRPKLNCITDGTNLKERIDSIPWPTCPQEHIAKDANHRNMKNKCIPCKDMNTVDCVNNSLASFQEKLYYLAQL